MANRLLTSALLLGLGSVIVAACGGGGDTSTSGSQTSSAGSPTGSGGMTTVTTTTGGMGGSGGSLTTSTATTTGTGGGGMGGSGGSLTTTTGTGGTGGCSSAADCDDGFSCTLDVCNGGTCSHTVGPNSGPTACPSGTSCQVGKGCAQGVGCATTAQCVAALGDDVCKVNILCDAATSMCTYTALDNDGDGHPPIVCGGDDCDDGDAARYPGAPEICDGKDNDCNGMVDDGATCPGLGICTNGSCACPPQDTCGAACVDTLTDPAHCGDCATACPSSATCQMGMCTCPTGLTLCGDACVDTMTDPHNCNACGTTCSSCQSGACTPCPTNDLFISQDLSSSMNDPLGAPLTRWLAARSAINAFAVDPLSAGIELGIGYFPVPPRCTTAVDCDPSGFFSCTNGFCDTGSDSCKVADYAIPGVPIALLPGNAAAIQSSMNAHQPSNASPQKEGLNGALSYAKAYVLAHAGHKASVVLITDGIGNECTGTTAADTAGVAATYAAGTPAVKTYVISIATDNTAAEWNQIAAAGGTGTAIPTGSQAQIQAALNTIRTTTSACP